MKPRPSTDHAYSYEREGQKLLATDSLDAGKASIWHSIRRPWGRGLVLTTYRVASGILECVGVGSIYLLRLAEGLHLGSPRDAIHTDLTGGQLGRSPGHKGVGVSDPLQA